MENEIIKWLEENFGGDRRMATEVLDDGIAYYERICRYSRDAAEVRDAKRKLARTMEYRNALEATNH